MKNLVGFIGRFQPFHLGNVDAVRQILEQEGEDTKIIFGIGSAEEELTEKNPFSLKISLKMDFRLYYFLWQKI